MRFDRKKLYNVSRAEVLAPTITAVWDDMCIGVAVVDADGMCVYMNAIQRRVDGFSKVSVVGRHITSLYTPHELTCIPTIECLRRGEPLLKKAYWYKTTNNYLASTVTDFFPLFDHGRKDGVLAFTIWVGTSALAESDQPLPRLRTPVADCSTHYTFDSLVGGDKALREVLKDAQIAAKTASPVMIWGESGTGKEMFAQAIHAAGPRREQPFIAVNCAAIPENLLEGILFGTAKGAYTDATDKHGLFEKADGGTLLLDELNSMPLGLQAKLLRVVQEKRVRRLGAHAEISVDVRIISVLNEAPLTAVERGILRSDLFYRLAVVGIAVPPLREHKEDIPLLVRTFIDRSDLCSALGEVQLADEVGQVFQNYDWPGNIRELLHVIEGSMALLGGRMLIEESCLPRHFREAYQRQGTPRPVVPVREASGAEEEYDDYRSIRRNSVIPLKERLHTYEARCIRNVLKVTGGNVAKAARVMQLTGAGLRYKMKLLSIGEDDY
ncbi:MAG: sigma 54-interacting transcriptional regulator [Desulfovibrionaceae bacterium]